MARLSSCACLFNNLRFLGIGLRLVLASPEIFPISSIEFESVEINLQKGGYGSFGRESP